MKAEPPLTIETPEPSSLPSVKPDAKSVLTVSALIVALPEKASAAVTGATLTTITLVRVILAASTALTIFLKDFFNFYSSFINFENTPYRECAYLLVQSIYSSRIILAFNIKVNFILKILSFFLHKKCKFF